MVLKFLRAYLFSKNANAHIKKMAWISVTGITVGSLSLIVVLSIMSGLNKSTEKRLLMSEPHLILMSKDGELAAFKKKINKEIKESERFERQDVLLKTPEGYFSGTVGLGHSKDSLEKKPSFYDAFNKPLTYEWEPFLKGESVFIGPELAFEMRIVVGDSLEIYKPEALLKSSTQGRFDDFKTLRVAGVLNSSGEGPESRVLIYHKGQLFKKSLSMEEGYEVFLKDPDRAQQFKSFFQDKGYKVQTWRDRNSSLFLALKIEKMAMTLLLGLALLITSFSIMTLLILIVIQKQKDIGILLSMGMSKLQIRQLYSRMGASLSLCGIGVGVGLGVLITLFLYLFKPRILPPIYQDPYLPVDLSLSTFLWVSFFCTLVALLSSIIPVFFISKITPVSALKETTKF